MGYYLKSRPVIVARASKPAHECFNSLLRRTGRWKEEVDSKFSCAGLEARATQNDQTILRCTRRGDAQKVLAKFWGAVKSVVPMGLGG